MKDQTRWEALELNFNHSRFLRLQDELNSDLDLSEARASLLSGDVVELINATSVDSTSMKLLWEVSERERKSFRRLSHEIWIFDS